MIQRKINADILYLELSSEDFILKLYPNTLKKFYSQIHIFVYYIDTIIIY